MGASVFCPKCGVGLRVDVSVGGSSPVAKPLFKKPAEANDDLVFLMEKINRDVLSGKDLEFYDGFKVRYDQYKAKTMASPKQISWLQDLANKSAAGF